MEYNKHFRYIYLLVLYKQTENKQQQASQQLRQSKINSTATQTMQNSPSSSQCKICHHKNSQILILSCGHDPCINCAAHHYFTGSQYRSEFQYIYEANYWCQICCEPTVIDAESVRELFLHVKEKGGNWRSTAAETLKRSKSYRPRNLSKNSAKFSGLGSDKIEKKSVGKAVSKQKETKKHSSKDLDNLVQMAQSQNIYSIKQSPHHEYCGDGSQKISIKTIKSSKNLRTQIPNNLFLPCKQHLDQQLSYYCFSCNASICVQCALHGSHVGHQIEAVRKAGNRLRTMYEGLIAEGQRCKIIVEGHIKQIQKAMEGFRKWNQKNIECIRQKFNELYQILAQRQKTILSQIQNIQKQGLQQLQNKLKSQQSCLSRLKQSRKILKTRISQPSQTWNISQLESTGKQLKYLCQSDIVLKFNTKNIDNSIKYVQTQLLSQAIDTIVQLVASFRVGIVAAVGQGQSQSQKIGRGVGDGDGGR